MINKRFLVPILALAAFGLPASADVTAYCSGSGCAAENNSQFTTDLASDNYTLEALIAFNATNGSLVGADYTDNTTQITFTSIEGNNLSLPGGGALATITSFGQAQYISLSIPSTIGAIQLSVTANDGICLDPVGPCPAATGAVTNGFVGFINSAPAAPWTVNVGMYLENGHDLQLNDFSVADVSGSQSPTPEVGTLLLIGSGLIAMRWMGRSRRRFFRTPLPA
jgi:hypothetical protein